MKLEDFDWSGDLKPLINVLLCMREPRVTSEDVSRLLSALLTEHAKYEDMVRIVRKGETRPEDYEVKTIAHVLATLAGDYTDGSALEWGSALQLWIKGFVRRTLGLGAPPRPVDEQKTGIYQKYLVERMDGSSRPGGKHETCDYFVLDWAHDPFAPLVMERYAQLCVHKYPELADSINLRLAKMGFHVCIGERRKHGDIRPSECAAPAVIPLGNGVWFCVPHAKGYDLGAEGSDALERQRVKGKAP